MKIKFLISVVLISTLSAFLFNNENHETGNAFLQTQSSNSFNDTFYVGVLDFGGGENHTTNQYHDSLKINLWHEYPRGFFHGWTNRASNDMLFADSNLYASQVRDVLSDNSSDGMRTLMHRIKIDYLANGQRSDYQCEAVHQDPDYWFYTYQTSITSDYIKDVIDTSIHGNGVKVKWCKPIPSNIGSNSNYIVKDLKANREQINYTAYSSKFMADQSWNWYIKPRIRIDSSEVDNNPNKLVCRVDIYNFNGYVEGNPSANRIKSIEIKTRHFLNSNFNYGGKYLEEFRFGTDTNLIINPILGDSLNPLTNINLFNPDTNGVKDMECKVDFRVYWYGLCDMWIDYVRVDNEIAHQLFSGLREDWFNWEIALANSGNSALKFYIEEFEFNQIPCMVYVSNKIDSLDGVNDFGLMCDLNYSTFKIHTPGFDTVRPSAEYIKRTLIDRLGSKEIFMGAYGFLTSR